MNCKQILVTLSKNREVISYKHLFSTCNFYGLPKVHKFQQINEAIQQQTNEYTEIHEPDNLTVRPIVGKPNCPTRP